MMRFEITNNVDNSKIKDFSTDNLYEFFFKTGKIVSELAPKTRVTVTDLDDDETIVQYQLIPSQGNKFIREEYWNDYSDLEDQLSTDQNCDAYQKMEHRYLTMVNPQWNNYKFYELTVAGGRFIAHYGRIYADPNSGHRFGPRSHAYALRMYWIKYFEKLAKGYTDQTKIKYPDAKSENRAKKAIVKADSKPVKKTTAQATDSPLAANLFKDLYSCSAQIVHSALISDDITYSQIKQAKAIYKTMLKRKTVNGFNRQLTKLLALSPRDVAQVADLMANDKSDFADIASREESLINSMDTVNSENTDYDNSFAGYGVQIYEATDKQADEVMSHIWRKDLRDRVTHIYRVIDPAKQKRFNKYLKDNQIKTIKEFFHGSTNENWLSIIKYGLELNPNASITGKMFGNDIYFAPDANKSYKYCSCEGTYWADGNSDHGYLGLYATAYGNPNKSDGEDDYDRACYSTKKETDWLKANGYNCLHAQSGSMLQNDEVVFYNEKAMLLNYLVEFSA